MPKRLLDRCNPDSIVEFRAAARQRYDDALALAAQGRRTAAIYVWGYAAEMTIKAAYFSFLGHPQRAPITWLGQLLPAINAGQAMIAWPNQGKGHNVRAWAEFLVLSRAANPATAYPASFAWEVQTQGQRIGQLWRETLRYHKNVAYRYEADQVRQATEWFLLNSYTM